MFPEPSLPPAAVSPWTRLRPLPGRSPSMHVSRAEGRSRLWLDERSLVQEIVRQSTQEIRRFAFDDIQAVQLRRTVRGLVYNIILGVPLFGLFLLTVTATDPLRVRLIYGASFAAPLVILLVVNILRGPTCRAVLTTALGPQLLPSLSRMRAARRALDEITVGVEAVQGALTPEEAVRQVDLKK